MKNQITGMRLACVDRDSDSVCGDHVAYVRAGLVSICRPTFFGDDVSINSRSGNIIHEGAHQYLGMFDRGYFINGLPREFVPPNETFFVQSSGNVITRVDSAQSDPVENGGIQIPVNASVQYLRKSKSQLTEKLPGGILFIEAEVLLSDGLCTEVMRQQLHILELWPSRIILHLVTNSQGALVSAESAMVDATMAEFLARHSMKKIGKYSFLIRSLSFYGVMAFDNYSYM